MNHILKLYHFLGGIRFALILIATVAIFVIAGTFIESYTESHRYAANLTYGNPIFALLLWGFFINILFSAMRRWPFQVRHIPFLITHLGLLMILGGALIKNYFGIQGNMGIMEGSGSHEIFETDSYALQIQDKKSPPKSYPIKRSLLSGFSSQIIEEGGLNIALADYTPHSVERFYSWVKAGRTSIANLPSLPQFEIAETADIDSLPSSKVQLENSSEVWHFYSLKAPNALAALGSLLGKHGILRFSDRTSNEILTEVLIKEAVLKPIELTDKKGNTHKVNTSSLLSEPAVNGILSPSIQITYNDDNTHPLNIQIPLDGSQALLNLNLSTSYLGVLPIATDLICEPTLAIIEDENEDIYVTAFDSNGYLWTEHFSQGNIPAIYAYDDGYAGYTLRAEPTFSKMSVSRDFKEETIKNYIKAQMRDALENGKELSPPLELLKRTCEEAKTDFVDLCLDFLTLWNQQNSWFFPKETPLPKSMQAIFHNLTWDSIPQQEKKALVWASHLFKHLDQDLQTGKNIVTILQEHQWPMLSSLDIENHNSAEINLDKDTYILTHLTQQMHALAEAIDPPHSPRLLAAATPAQKAHFFSIYLRMFAIHLNTITPTLSTEEMQNLLANAKGITVNNSDPLILETVLIAAHRKLLPEKKLEDNLPAISLKAYKKGVFQAVSLSYNRFGSGLKWPILNGEYLVRFQPQFIEIPYQVRLRSARQINYANSNQPFSFESDVIITDRRTGHSTEKTISMNNVHETWDGYRFYLANITPPTEIAVKQVQLIVNHDPAKYWLTYPGAIIMTLGIILLFWMRPYKIKQP